MDNLLLDGHLGIVFALALAVLRVEAPAINALHGEALVDALKARSPEIARDRPSWPEIARDCPRERVARRGSGRLTLGP